jgi:hypothetical protein
MPKQKTLKEKYQNRLHKQQEIFEEFASHEIEWADDLFLWYRTKKPDMPDDKYRAVTFFKSREYLHKPGSFTLLYEMYRRCIRELPEAARETAFDLLAYRLPCVLRNAGKRRIFLNRPV